MQSKPSSFSPSALLTLGIFAALVVSFAVYAWAEHKVVDAIEQRHQSFLLADELRQTSDDLTKMVRIYVETGDVRYKNYYQLILDIRDGKRPRPLGYQKIYWDFVKIQGAMGIKYILRYTKILLRVSSDSIRNLNL